MSKEDLKEFMEQVAKELSNNPTLLDELVSSGALQRLPSKRSAFSDPTIRPIPGAASLKQSVPPRPPLRLKACLHVPSTCGQSDTDDSQLLYRGVAYRVPRAAFEQQKFDEYEMSPITLFKDLGDEEPAPEAILERYEVWDIETGDMLVMYRVPYRLKPPVGGRQ